MNGKEKNTSNGWFTLWRERALINENDAKKQRERASEDNADDDFDVDVDVEEDEVEIEKQTQISTKTKVFATVLKANLLHCGRKFICFCFALLLSFRLPSFTYQFAGWFCLS